MVRHSHIPIQTHLVYYREDMNRKGSSKGVGDRSGEMPEAPHLERSVIIAYLVLLVLHAAPLVIGTPKLWGTDQWEYLPGAAVAACAVFGLLVLVPSFRAALVRIAIRIGRAAPLVFLMKRRLAGYVVLLAVSAALFWRFRSVTHFLGDGYLWANHILKDIIFNEPVSSWIYREAYRLLGALRPTPEVTPVGSANVVSVAAGLIFIVFAVKTARLLSDRNDARMLAFITLASTGMMLLFFGYVETYPPLAAAVMAFTFYGIAYARGLARSYKPIAAFVIAAGLHLSGIALLPGLILLLWTRSGRTIRRKRFYAIFSAAVVAGLAVLWALQRWRLFGGFFFDKFMPLFPGPPRNRIAYPLFSWKTLFDSFNQIVFICPMALFLLTGLVRPSRPHDGETRRVVLFLETMVLFYLLEFAVFNKNIGVSRDWDLFAAMAIPLALLTALVLMERFPRTCSALSVIAFAVLLFHTVPLVSILAGREASERRFIELVDTGYWSSYAKGYGYSTLGIYYKRIGEQERGVEFSEKAVAADPKNPRYWYNLATIYYDEKRHEEAVELYRRVIAHDPERLEARNNLGVIYWETGRLGLAEREFSTVVASDSTYIQSYEPLAYIHFERGNLDACGRLYRKSRELGHDMTPFFKEMVNVHREDAEIEKSIAMLEMLLGEVPNDIDLHVSLAGLYRRWGEHERALASFGRAFQLAPANPDMSLEYGMALYYAGRREAALEHLLSLYRRDDRDIRVINNIGVIYSEGGEHEKAVPFFERSVEVHPGNASLRVNLARTYFELGEYAKAWEQVITAEKLGVPAPDDFLEKLHRAMPRPSP